MKRIFNVLKNIFNQLKKDHISEYAAECAYFTILSFIPFIMFFLTLVQYTNIEKETIYIIIKELTPQTTHQLIIGVIDEIYSKSIGTLSITVIIALWSSGKGFFSLCKGLRKIYRINFDAKSNIFIRIEGTIYTLIFIVAIIIFLLIVVLGNRIYELIINRYEKIAIITSYLLKIRFILLISIMFIIFLLIYKFIPRHNLKIKTQIYGALFSSISWYGMSCFFSIYIDLFKGFSNIYGSLSSIILIMMWVYICMYMILLGGEINVFLNRTKNIRQNSRKYLN